MTTRDPMPRDFVLTLNDCSEAPLSVSKIAAALRRTADEIERAKKVAKGKMLDANGALVGNFGLYYQGMTRR